MVYQKPPGEDTEAWEKAWAERPNDAYDPPLTIPWAQLTCNSCVPVRANGFNDLDQRVQSQKTQVNQFRASLHTIQEKLNAIQSQHDQTTSIKLEDCRRRHMALARRALSLAAKVQVLKNRGYALQPEEETLKKRLEGLAKSVQDPAATGRMNEIWARMMVVQEKARVMEESMGKVEIVWDESQLQITGKASCHETLRTKKNYTNLFVVTGKQLRRPSLPDQRSPSHRKVTRGVAGGEPGPPLLWRFMMVVEYNHH